METVLLDVSLNFGCVGFGSAFLHGNFQGITAPFTRPRRTTLISKPAWPAARCATVCSASRTSATFVATVFDTLQIRSSNQRSSQGGYMLGIGNQYRASVHRRKVSRHRFCIDALRRQVEIVSSCNCIHVEKGRHPPSSQHCRPLNVLCDIAYKCESQRLRLRR